jgi:hypothetical protein
MAESVESEVRATRIVVGGLIAGLTMFSLIALAVGPINKSPDPLLGRLMLAGLALAALAGAAAYFALRLAMRRDLAARAAELRQHADPATLILARYRQFAIAGGGVIEGPGFFAAMTYLVTGNPVALGAVACVVLLLLAHMPSVDHLRRLAETAAMGNEV